MTWRRTATRDLPRSHYILLSTFRRDGSAVGTPMWAAEEPGRLFVWTETNSFKVRRIRGNPVVTVQPCTSRGVTRGVAVSGRAELLDDAGTARVRTLLAHKYGILGWLAVRWPWPSYFRPSKRLIRDIVTGRRPSTIGISITLDQAVGSHEEGND